MMRLKTVAVGVVGAAAVAAAALVAQAQGGRMVEWTAYASDKASTTY